MNENTCVALMMKGLLSELPDSAKEVYQKTYATMETLKSELAVTDETKAAFALALGVFATEIQETL